MPERTADERIDERLAVGVPVAQPGSPVSADTARRAALEVDRQVLVDFDHTLFSSNSTELFISRCRPSFVVALIDLVVRVCIPWRLVPGRRGHRIGDYLCVLLIVVLTPWNVRRWQAEAPALFARQRAAGVSALFVDVDRSRLTIISFGMAFVIRALVRGSEYESAALLATSMRPRPSWFAGGKTATAVAALGREAVSRAVFVTDSLDDADLLAAAGAGLLLPPQGERLSSRERLYVPMRYTAQVKFSRWYTLDQFVLVDALLIVIAVSYDVASLLHFVLVVPLLLLSLMAVYEIGYYENDMHASKTEERPVLGEAVARFREYPIRVQSWVWAVGAAAAGLWLAVLFGELRPDEVLGAGLSWAGLLLALRALFYVYNRTRVEFRTLLYPALQALKYGAVFLVFVPTVVGVVLVMSQIMAMWATYVVYRLDGRKDGLDRDLFRTAAFVVVVGLLGVSSLVHGGLLDAGRGQANVFCCVLALLWSAARIAKAPVMARIRPGRTA